MYTGLNLSVQSSGAALPPDGLENRVGILAEHASVNDLRTLDASTDVASIYGASDSLTAELKAMQANAGTKFWAVIQTVATGDLTSTNVATQIATMRASHQFSLIAVLHSVDSAYAGALKTELLSLRNQKIYHEALLRWRQTDTANSETPTDYAAAFSAEWSAFECEWIGVVAPTTEDDWTGAVAGRISRLSVEKTVAATEDGGLASVDTDADYADSHLRSLDSHRAIFLKRHPENPSAVMVNDDNSMASASGTIRTLATARVANKAARQILAYGYPLIGSSKFNRDDSGARAAGQVAAQGLEKMLAKTPYPEIGAYELSASWGTSGNLTFVWSVYDVNRIKIVENEVMLLQPET